MGGGGAGRASQGRSPNVRNLPSVRRWAGSERWCAEHSNRCGSGRDRGRGLSSTPLEALKCDGPRRGSLRLAPNSAGVEGRRLARRPGCREGLCRVSRRRRPARGLYPPPQDDAGRLPRAGTDPSEAAFRNMPEAAGLNPGGVSRPSGVDLMTRRRL